MMRRQSSQSSHHSRHAALSPGSAGDHQHLRHHVKPRKAQIVLPTRNHSSARNLVKLARLANGGVNAAAAAEGRRKHARTVSHESEQEIRLPRSLETTPPPQTLRRNLTSYQLPRTVSHAKLKKNFSHGQLTRLSSGKNLAALSGHKGPPSPGLKGRNSNKRRSADAAVEMDLHEREVELAQQQTESAKRDGRKVVGFAVGSSGDDDEDDAPQMEGSGLQEDEWTDQSASASPYSTRQNTASNSRRTSILVERPPEKVRVSEANGEANGQQSRYVQPVAVDTHSVTPQGDGTHEPQGEEHEAEEEDEAEDDAEEEDEAEDDAEEADGEEVASPKSTTTATNGKHEEIPEALPQHQPKSPQAIPRSPISGAKDHPNPATRHLLARQNQGAAPALVSNVSALDDARSSRATSGSIAHSSGAVISDETPDSYQDELVSRFVPSTSHPSIASGGNTNVNTPRAGSLHTPEGESTLDSQPHLAKRNSTFGLGPVSPGSALSVSSGTVTPALQRSRNEIRLMNDKVMAELEDAAARNPVMPGHVYDRRNESLKSWLNLAMLGGDGRGGLSAITGLSTGPEIFEGRFKAVNTELKVVQRFRNPIAESVSRLLQCKDGKVASLRTKHSAERKRANAAQPPPATSLPISKSSASLPRQPSKLSTSVSPPAQTDGQGGGKSSASALTSAKSATQVAAQGQVGESKRSRVTFVQTPAERREMERGLDEKSADAIARKMWEGVAM